MVQHIDEQKRKDNLYAFVRETQILVCVLSREKTELSTWF